MADGLKGSAGLKGEDAKLWENITRSITPLRKKAHKKPYKKPHEKYAAEKRIFLKTMKGEMHNKANMSPAENTSSAENMFEKPHPKTPAPVVISKKGRKIIYPLRKIDLHGYSLQQAHEKIERTIIRAYEGKCTAILFITGKGFDYETLQNKGRIKNEITKWLEAPAMQKYVKTYHTPSNKYGGEGALLVTLRKK